MLAAREPAKDMHFLYCLARRPALHWEARPPGVAVSEGGELMRITGGTIYLAQPVFGRRRLTGAATIGTTWLDYTFADDADAADPPSGVEADATPPPGWRVLIPITNVTAVVVGPADMASGRGSGLP
jgi:hypothetical protein